jgi:ribokinase
MSKNSGPHILVVGSSNTDLVITGARLPSPGETLLGGAFARFAGGKGANQAVAAARAGARVSFVGARGDDDLGRGALGAMRREGIDCRRFSVRKNVTSGVALILLGGKNRENMIVVANSANDRLTAGDIRKAAREIALSQVVVAQLEIPLPAVREAARLAAQSSVPFILNPAPARKLPASLLKLVHILTPNEHEAAHLTGVSDPKRAGRLLLQQGCQNVVITLGAKGALVIDSKGTKHFAAPKVKVLDTVGAGDCFSGWLAVGVAKGYPLDKSVKYALAAASLAVTRRGAQAGMPYRHEVMK